MTLAEMASFVTQKVNQTETEDVTACKSFLRRRYEMIWHDQLWKDSLAQVNLTLDPTNADNAAGVVVLPELIDRPVAIRGADRQISVNPLERYYRIDLDMFARTGAQYECALMNPAWVTVRPAANPYNSTAVAVSPAETYNIPGFNFFLLGSFVIGDWYRWTPGPHETQVTDVATVLASGTSPVIFRATNSTLRMWGTPNTLWTGTLEHIDSLKANQSPGAGSFIRILSSSLADNVPIKVIYRDLAGKRYEYVTNGPLILLNVDDDAGYFEIEAIFKSTTAGTVSITLQDSLGFTYVLGTMLPGATRTPCYQRVRVFDMPNQSAAIKVAGKVKCDTLDFDYQEPMLRGCENILLCFAQADMLERERRYGQAQAMLTEGGMLLEQLKRIEVVQQAHNVRIIPQFGFISEYDLYASNLLSF